MAKDDFCVIVYQILSYLYTCLKKGLTVEVSYLMPQGKLFQINEIYWRYIMYNLHAEGYIDGITITKAWGERYPVISDLERIGITPSGIQYLTDNKFIRRAVDMLKDVNAMIPFT